MDLTPLVPPGKHVVQRYGNGRFVIAGEAYQGPILLSPYQVFPWSIKDLADMTVESLNAILGPQEGAPLELILLGCGSGFIIPPLDVRRALAARHIALEPMDTGAACRTFNVLASEDRRVAAALISI